MDSLSKLPERLKELMFYHGEIKSEALAAKIGVYGSSVRAWMNGKSLISLNNAIKLADFFSCSLDYLAGLRDTYEEVKAKPCPEFYERLRNVMIEKNISRYEIVKKTEIPDVYFTKWSRGAVPDLISIIKIAKHLDVSLDYLVGRTDY